MKEVERGAGIITYTLSNENKPLFLILKGGATIWGFPKGHQNKSRKCYTPRHQTLLIEAPA